MSMTCGSNLEPYTTLTVYYVFLKKTRPGGWDVPLIFILRRWCRDSNPGWLSRPFLQRVVLTSCTVRVLAYYVFLEELYRCIYLKYIWMGFTTLLGVSYGCMEDEITLNWFSISCPLFSTCTMTQHPLVRWGIPIPTTKPRATTSTCAVNFLSVKIASSDVGLPICVYGTVIVRDSDEMCLTNFRRDSDHCQLINSEVLTF
jgi:hypothetical protein